METPLCISYIRFSSASQSDGASFDRQFDLAKDYAGKHGLTLDEKYSYRDLGVSAFDGEHAKSGHLRSFLDLVEQGKIPKGSILLVESLDRLNRENHLDAFQLFYSILKKDIKIITLNNGVEYTKDSLTDDFGRMVLAISDMSRAHKEVEDRRKRIIDAFSRKRTNLDNEKFTANCPTWLKLSSDRKSFLIGANLPQWS